MTTKSLSHILIKIAGVVILIYTTVHLPNYITSYSYSEVKTFSYFFFSVITPNILSLGIGLWLFLGYERFTNRLLLKEENAVLEANQKTFEIIEQIALSVLGFYLLFDIISVSSYDFTNWFFAKAKALEQSPLANFDNTYFYILVASRGIELIFATWLILKPRGIAHVLYKLRNSK